MAPRRRDKNPQLDPYPGMWVETRTGIYYIKHPVTKKSASLKTKDFDRAKQLYAILVAKWKREAGELAADALIRRFEELATEDGEKTIPFVADYVGEWREKWLGVTPWQQGKRTRYHYNTCKVLSKRKRPLGKTTVENYAGYCLNYFEKSDLLRKTKLDHKKITIKLRQFLSDFALHPTTYNHLLSCLSKIFQQAVKDGLIAANPCRDIDLAIIPEKTEEEIEAQYIDDDAYAKITQAMMIDEYGGKAYDGEWQARLVDMMLFMSSRPADAISIRDDAFDNDGVLKYETNKTDELIWVEDTTGELAETVLWFRSWKRKHHVISPLLCVQPLYKRLGVAGTPVTVKYLSRRFAKAVVAAGYPKGRWSLRLIRHKGLTDEAVKNQTNNKGGHRTESAKKKYQTKRLPTRVQNTLVNPRKQAGKVSAMDRSVEQ